MGAHDPEHKYVPAGPGGRRPNISSDSLSPRPISLSSSVKAEEIAASMKQLEILCWNLLELSALDARAPPQLTSTVRADQTRINRHAKITWTYWCHCRSLVASYSIVIKHHFGMGDSAWCKAVSNLAVRVSLTVAVKSSLWLVHSALPMRVTRSLVLY